jgi:hypothetical protein
MAIPLILLALGCFFAGYLALDVYVFIERSNVSAV